MESRQVHEQEYQNLRQLLAAVEEEQSGKLGLNSSTRKFKRKTEVKRYNEHLFPLWLIRSKAGDSTSAFEWVIRILGWFWWGQILEL